MNSFLNFIYRMFDYKKNFRLDKDKWELTQRLIDDYNEKKLKET